MLPVTCPSGVLPLPAPPTWQTLGVPTPQVPHPYGPAQCAQPTLGDSSGVTEKGDITAQWA